ncbi:MAG: hypothetical protein ISN29_05030 [Gammaproteobacteria bacterium AqS3]|nr:hypothetical protein [Gammaproteobacteria bacterium AqS3]
MPVYAVSYLSQTNPNLWEYQSPPFGSLDEAVEFAKKLKASSNPRELKIIKMAIDKVVYDSARHDLDKLTPSGEYEYGDLPWQVAFIRQREQRRFKCFNTLFEAIDWAKPWIRHNKTGEVWVKNVNESGYWFVGSNGCYWDGTLTQPKKYYCKQDRNDRATPCNSDCLCSTWIP